MAFPLPDTERTQLFKFECQSYTAQKQLTSSDLNEPEKLCEHLEAGGILYFPVSPLFPSQEDLQFLLTQKQLEVAHHKNIAYRPLQNRLTGVASNNKVDVVRLQSILKTYSQQSGYCLDQILSPYKGWQWDYASYRPIEEQGRPLRLHARNDLIHIDSFPTRPTFGGRILRLFTNIHPAQARIWQTSDTLIELVEQFKSQLPLNQKQKTAQPGRNLVQALLKSIGCKQSGFSPYDSCMSKLHNLMKEDKVFQASCRKTHWEFPPGSSWMVMTDMLSHSVLSGQYALEQTVIVPFERLLTPQFSPLHILGMA